VESKGFSIPTPIGIMGFDELLKKSQQDKRRKQN
jgi:hypothetical protein